jgi:hydrogenase nickel incorporation protein HypA/HybF
MPMHEFALTQNLFDIAIESADSKRILRVNLLIGPFSKEREESIQCYWRDLARGTLGDGAELHFDHATVNMKCLDCNGTFYLDEKPLCTYCDSERLPLLNGDDVRLESIEVE